jgi:Ca2+:H+ antiporter
MIVLDGLVGPSLLLGGLRHRLQAFNLSGANAYLVVLLAIAVTDLLLPRFTGSAPGGGLSPLRVVFAVATSLLL